MILADEELKCPQVLDNEKSYVPCKFGGGNELVTCAISEAECPITGLRMVESEATCDEISSNYETCLDLTAKTKLIFSKNSGSFPLTHFKVEEN